MPAGNEEQFKFLISCIRYSNNGKVASECGIVTKGAAAKRYERMMKAHGIAPNAASVRQASGGPRPKMGSSKKRKADQFADERATADDDEDFDNIKPEARHPDQPRTVKEEAMPPPPQQHHHMYSPGHMGDELGLDLMSVKDEAMARAAYDDQSLNQYLHLAHGDALYGPGGLHSVAGARSAAAPYGDLDVAPGDVSQINHYFAQMEQAYGVPPPDAYGLNGFEGDELVLVDAHGRPT